MDATDIHPFQKYNTPKNILVIGIIAFLLLLRLAFMQLMGPMPQDAYYFFYSEHLALSYFDHPPAIAYILHFFTSLLGKNVFVIKLADTIITGLSLFFFYRLALQFLSRHVAIKAIVLLFSTLMITILSLVSTPDIPLILCWTISLLLLYQAIFKERKIYWLWAGIMMGLAFDSKYTGVFLPFCTILFLILSTKYRKLLLPGWSWLAVPAFLATILPVLIWNYQHDFVSIRFQSAERIGKTGALHFSFQNFIGFLGHQSAILMPVVFFGLIYFLVKTVGKYRYHFSAVPDKKLFLLCFFLPVFLVFFLLSPFYWVKLNWMMPSYITGIIWLSTYFKRKWIHYQLIISGVIHLFLAVEIVFYPFPVKSDDTWVGWEELSQKVSKVQQKHPGTFVFSADDYKTSAVLNLYLDIPVYSKNILGENALQFDYIGTDINGLKGKDAIFIDSEPRFTNYLAKNSIPPNLRLHFETVTELEPLLIMKNGRPVRKFFVYMCTHYKGL